MKTFVILNRFVGATTERKTEAYPYEMLVPVKTKNGKFKSPKPLADYKAGFAFKQYLENGETVLVNPNGGWCNLSSTDHVVKIWQE